MNKVIFLKELKKKLTRLYFLKGVKNKQSYIFERI